MLEYLVTSKTRRTLLKLLWQKGESGTISELAEQSGVAFSGAHRELSAMAESGLARVRWNGRSKEYSANLNHPMSSLVGHLVDSTRVNPDENKPYSTDLREHLAYLGLPVNSRKTPPTPDLDLETLLVEAAVLAREDASVARSLPVFVFRNRLSFDVEKLKHESWKKGNKHEVGFFLDVTGKLAGDPFLTEAARKFLDKRYRATRPLFKNESAASKRLAEMRTPEIARKWRLRMNMTLDAFEDVFRKHVNETVPA